MSHQTKGASAGEVPTKERKVTFAGEPTVYYANNAAIQVSNFDVRLQFGLIQDASEQAVNIKRIADVYMTHEHFNLMYDLITQYVESIRPVKVEPAP